MALNALTLSTTQGVQGRPFQATISGLTTGRLEVLGDASPGFSVVNGQLMSQGLPYPVSTVSLREYEPGVGVGYRDTRIDITAVTRDQLRTQALAALPAGRTMVRFRTSGTQQADGSIVYSIYVEDDLGATTVQPAGQAPVPPPLYPQFAVGTKAAVLGDSLSARGFEGASPGTNYVMQTALGGIEVANSIFPVLLMEQWPANTQSEDSGYITKWTTGANRALSGSPSTVHAARVSGVIAMGVKILYYSATINSRSLPDNGQYIIDNILIPARNAGIYLWVGGIRPVGQGGQFDDANYRANRPLINAALKTWIDAQGPQVGIWVDHDAYADPGKTGYGAADLYEDGTHWNGKGAMMEGAYLAANIMTKNFAAGGNRLKPILTAGPNLLPNATMTGTGGATAFGVSGSVPAGWRVAQTGQNASSAVVSLEANADTGGQSTVLTITPVVTTAQFVGGISGNTLTVSSVTSGTLAIGMKLSGAGIGDNTYLASGSGTNWQISGLAVTVPTGTSMTATRHREQFQISPTTNSNTGDVTLSGVAGKFLGAIVEVEVDNSPGWMPPAVSLTDLTVSTHYATGLGYTTKIFGKSDGVGRTWWVFVNAVGLDASSTGIRFTVTPQYNPAILTTGAKMKLKSVGVLEIGDPKPRWNS